MNYKQSDIDQLREKGLRVINTMPVGKKVAGKAAEGARIAIKPIPTVQRQTIYGVCPSKSNCYRFTKDGRMYKTPALAKYEKDFFIQCNHYRNKKIGGYFEIYLDVFYPNQRSDLDNSLKVILDCLQVCKAIENDNKLVKIVANKFLDKANPRIEFTISPV